MSSTALLAALLVLLLLWWLFRHLKLERDISLLYVLFRVKRKQAEYIRCLNPGIALFGDRYHPP
jgi:hypothetical protein